VDVNNWLRPDAPTSPDRLFCHVYGRGRSADQFIPGWPYSFVAALETGRTSWTAVLDAIRLGPADDVTAVTAAQLREVFTRLVRARQWKPGDADILIVMDAGYDVTRLAYVLADLPVELVGRLRSDRVMLRDAGPRRSTPRGGQPRTHGGVLTFAKPDSWHTPDQATACDTTRYGTAEALAWDRTHARLMARGPWLDHCGELPLIHGTLNRRPRLGPARLTSPARPGPPPGSLPDPDIFKPQHPHRRQQPDPNAGGPHTSSFNPAPAALPVTRWPSAPERAVALPLQSAGWEDCVHAC
jgi:hypothetical protein